MCLTLLFGFVIFIYHGNSNKQDFINVVSKVGTYPVCVGLCECTEPVPKYKCMCLV